MHEPVIWLGGWASNLGCWRNRLEELYPDREHAFLDAHSVVAEPGLLRLAISSLPRGGTFIAWSLGSLLLHRGLADLEWEAECGLVSISPIFDFCREDGPWPPAALIRMTRKLPKSRETVLNEFLDLVQGRLQMQAGEVEAWKIQSRKYTLDALLEGLEALGGIVIKNSQLPKNPRHVFLCSVKDPLAPPNREDFPGPGWIGYPEGHLPFLDYPNLLRPLLDGHFPEVSA